MPTQINVTSNTEIVAAKTYDGWHLDELIITFNSSTITGLGKLPHIMAFFVPWEDDGAGGKIAHPEHRKKVSVTNPVRVGEIYDLYVKSNTQLGPAIENMAWREGQTDLSIPQAEINALPVVVSATQF